MLQRLAVLIFQHIRRCEALWELGLVIVPPHGFLFPPGHMQDCAATNTCSGKWSLLLRGSQGIDTALSKSRRQSCPRPLMHKESCNNFQLHHTFMFKPAI